MVTMLAVLILIYFHLDNSTSVQMCRLTVSTLGCGVKRHIERLKYLIMCSITLRCSTNNHGYTAVGPSLAAFLLTCYTQPNYSHLCGDANRMQPVI